MPTFYTESDLPLADRDQVVTQVIEHGVEINRKVFAGQRVPPDLIEAYEAANSTSKSKPAAKRASDDKGA